MSGKQDNMHQLDRLYYYSPSGGGSWAEASDDPHTEEKVVGASRETAMPPRGWNIIEKPQAMPIKQQYELAAAEPKINPLKSMPVAPYDQPESHSSAYVASNNNNSGNYHHPSHHYNGHGQNRSRMPEYPRTRSMLNANSPFTVHVWRLDQSTTQEQVVNLFLPLQVKHVDFVYDRDSPYLSALVEFPDEESTTKALTYRQSNDTIKFRVSSGHVQREAHESTQGHVASASNTQRKPLNIQPRSAPSAPHSLEPSRHNHGASSSDHHPPATENPYGNALPSNKDFYGFQKNQNPDFQNQEPFLTSTRPPYSRHSPSFDANTPSTHPFRRHHGHKTSNFSREPSQATTSLPKSNPTSITPSDPPTKIPPPTNAFTLLDEQSA